MARIYDWLNDQPRNEKIFGSRLNDEFDGIPISAADYATHAAVEAATVDGGTTYIRTNGYAAVGDGGGGLYAASVSEPSHDGKVQSADGAWWELVEERAAPYMFGVSDAAAAFNSAAAYLAARGGGVLDMQSRTYTFEAPLTVEGDYITIDAQGAVINFDHDTGPCLTFGDGTTQFSFCGISGGRWQQLEGCDQYLFEVRRLRHFSTDGMQCWNLYSYMHWGRTDDAAPSYIWYETNMEISHRAPVLGAGGHSHSIYIENSTGSWNQSNVINEGFEGATGIENDGIRLTAAIYFPSSFVPARFDHWMTSNVFFKGFTYGILVDDCRLANIDWTGGLRIDDCRAVTFNGSFSVADSGIGSLKGDLSMLNAPTGIGVDLTLNHASASCDQFQLNVVAQGLTSSVVTIEVNAGSFIGAEISCHCVNWTPDADATYSAVSVNRTGGTIDTFSFPSITIRSANANDGEYALAKFGTTTNFVYGLLNYGAATTAAANF